MKRFYVLFATLLALNICVPPVTHAQDGEVGEVGGNQIGAPEAPEAIVIIDTHLASAIRATLGLAEDATLTSTDMLNLSSLQAKKAEISDLSGLEHATNLTTLNLYGNQLTDISPLSELEGLIVLDLGKNEITDIAALSGLTALTSLHLDRNPITDFRPLSSLTGVSVLHLSRTGISDLSVLGSLTTLTQLYLTGNEISDIGALATLTELGWLFLAQNEISDVSPLVDMEALVSLRLLGNPVSNASVLYPLTQGSLIDVDIEIPPPADTEPPSVTIAVPADTQNGAFEVTITFSEVVSGFEQADVLVSGTAIVSITAWQTTDNTVWTATLTPTTSGILTLSVAADVATNAANNPNTAATPQTVTVDMGRPTVSIGVPSGTQTGAFDATITFTEGVSDFVQADLSLGGTATASITAWDTTDNTVFTATITPTTSGTVTLDIAADVATDAASNGNTAATTESVTVEIIPDPSTWMSDANLRSAVRSALGLAANENFSKADLATLTSLSATKSQIADLTGLEYATGLTTLVAWQNDITGLEPIQDLTTLTEIRIGNNDISDLQPLAGLTALTKLGLQSNNISDVSALSGLVNLTWLRLAHNPVTDFSPLSGLKTNITDVDITIPDPDTTRPTVSITVPSGAQNGAFNVTITFAEVVSDFVPIGTFGLWYSVRVHHSVGYHR